MSGLLYFSSTFISTATWLIERLKVKKQAKIGHFACFIHYCNWIILFRNLLRSINLLHIIFFLEAIHSTTDFVSFLLTSVEWM